MHLTTYPELTTVFRLLVITAVATVSNDQELIIYENRVKNP